MGNYISCTLSTTTGKYTRGAKVILPTGEIRQFEGPVKAAEVMFETPNYFLVNSRSLQMGRRFSALNADEDVEMGNVYVMFPMKRVNSVITAADMGALFVSGNSAAKRAYGGCVRILPEACASARVMPESMVKNIETPRLILEDIEDISVTEFQLRLSMSRSRKPLLETITEEPVCLR